MSTVHPIAYRLDACMEEGEWEPEAALSCASEAQQAWQEEVKRLTERLDGVLGKEAREALELSDQAWRKSLDADLALVERYHEQLEEAELGESALLPVSRQLLRNRLLEARVMQLLRLLDGLASLVEEDETTTLPP
ncbi:hypothetical protein GCM10017767_21270 [Halomonas urumqiensis]|nr:hypothetical protein GCM10017767_21270 [Halomonas urumqiensis]